MADLSAGRLSLLPRELRDVILRHLLVAPSGTSTTFGDKSNIFTSILRTCRLLYEEGSSIVYSTAHVITLTREHSTSGEILGAIPPPHALRRLKHLSLSLNFSSHNRGECETGIVQAQRWIDKCLSIGLVLLQSRELLTLRMGMWNRTQRKVGARRLRAERMRDEVREMLKVFAYVRHEADVRIEGFDVLEWIELFEDMRNECKGKEIPFEEWIEESMGDVTQHGPSSMALK